MKRGLGRLAAVAALTVLILCAGGMAAVAEDIPALPQPIDWAYALPEPVRAAFAPGQRFDVYSGPGTQYVREAGGRASVSTNDWILVFGEENGWLLIAYRISADAVRVGYIQATQQQAGVAVPQLAWAGETCEIYDRLSSDPTGYFNQSDELLTQEEGTLLGALGEEWGYVQSQRADGTPVRGFIHVESMAVTTPQSERATVTLRAGQSVPLYDAPDGAQIGSLYAGASIAVKEEAEGMLRVICRGNAWGNAILSPVAEGWVSRSQVLRGMGGWESLSARGYDALRYVTLAGEDTPYALIAETGDMAYLETIPDGRGTLVRASDVLEASRGILYAWDGKNVPLYDSNLLREPARVREAGAKVYVFRQEGDMALISLSEDEEWGLAYWVKAENLMLVM